MRQVHNMEFESTKSKQERNGDHKSTYNAGKGQGQGVHQVLSQSRSSSHSNSSQSSTTINYSSDNDNGNGKCDAESRSIEETEASSFDREKTTLTVRDNHNAPLEPPAKRMSQHFFLFLFTWLCLWGLRNVPWGVDVCVSILSVWNWMSVFACVHDGLTGQLNYTT